MKNQTTVSEFIAATDKSDRTVRTHRKALEDRYSIQLTERRGQSHFILDAFKGLLMASLDSQSLPPDGTAPDDLQAFSEGYLRQDSPAELEPPTTHAIPAELVTVEPLQIQATAPTHLAPAIDLGAFLGIDSTPFEATADSYRDQSSQIEDQLQAIRDEAARQRGIARARREAAITEQAYAETRLTDAAKSTHTVADRARKESGNA